MPIDPVRMFAAQKRVLVLGRFNADGYNPRAWWQSDGKRKSLVYRFRVVPAGQDTPANVIALPESGDRIAALYEHLCPGFREEVRLLKLSDHRTRVAFTAAATPAKEDLPESAHPAVTLYPGHPLLDPATTGFDLLSRLAEDLDRLIKFEQGDGYWKLLRLFNRYCVLFGGQKAVSLPSALTEFGQLPAYLASAILDAVFAPGAKYEPTEVDAKTLANADTDFGLDRGTLLSLVRGFRWVCTTVGTSVVRPPEDGDVDSVTQEALDVSGVASNFDTATFLAQLQAARNGLNRVASIIQSNLLLGSIVDWLLSGGSSQVADQKSFKEKTEEAFRLGVADGDTVAVGAELCQHLRQRMQKHLRSHVSDDHSRARLMQLYDLGEAYLTNAPVFRVGDVVDAAAREAVLLLEEALAEGDPKAMGDIQKAARNANGELAKLLKNSHRELLIPGLTLTLEPIRVGPTDDPLFVNFKQVAEGVRVTIHGAATRDNVSRLFSESAKLGPDGANAVYQAFYHAQTVLPEGSDVQLDAIVVGPYAKELEKAEAELTSKNAPIREGFGRAIGAVHGTAVYEARPLPASGGIWARTTAAGTGHAIATTGMRDTQSRVDRYNPDATVATVKSLPPSTVSTTDLDTEMFRLVDGARAFVKNGGDDLAGELKRRAAQCMETLDQLDSTQDLHGRWVRVVRAVLAVLFEARVRSAAEEAVNVVGTEPLDTDRVEALTTTVTSLASELARHADPTNRDLVPLTSTSRVQQWAEMLTTVQKELSRKEAGGAQRIQGRIDALQVDEGAAGELELERNWLYVLKRTDAPIAPTQSSVSDTDLGHYFDARETIVQKYAELAKPGTDGLRDFCSRTRYVWLAQLLVHLHKRLPLANGRADAGNVAGLVMELLKCWRPKADTAEESQPNREAREMEIRKVFFDKNAGALPKFLPVQTLAHIQSLARGYRDKTLESVRTLRDMRTDMKGLEYLIERLPPDGELVIVNMTADDFTELDWDRYEEMFDASRLGPVEGECLIPSALLVTRSAQQWLTDEWPKRVKEFLQSLDAKLRGSKLQGRCVIPPVFISVETNPEVAEPKPDSDPRAVRKTEAKAIDAAAQRFEELRPQLTFPVFAVGMTALLRGNETPAAHAPYFLMARLCEAELFTPAHREKTTKKSKLVVRSDANTELPTHSAVLAFASPGEQELEDLVDSWFGRADRVGVYRRLGADYFAWIVSVIFRAEIGAGAPHTLPTPQGFKANSLTDPLNKFWRHFLLIGPPPKPTPSETAQVAAYDHGYLARPAGVGAGYFGGWRFAQPTNNPSDSWTAFTDPASLPHVTRVPIAGQAVAVPWLRRLLTELYSKHRSEDQT